MDALDPRADTVHPKGVATPADGVETVENAAETSRARAPSGFLARLRPLDATEPVLHLGIDENGLGPLLGPMIVTAVAFRIAGPRPSSLGTLVGDSKALVSHADVSLGEAWTRALLAAVGSAPTTPDEIVARVSMDDAATLRAPCPPPPTGSDATTPVEHHAASMCWPPASEPFVADDALVEKCARVIRGWTAREREGGRFVRRTPIQFLGLRASILCASRLNAAMAAGRHKFVIDLHEMERLALTLHETFAARDGRAIPLDAICGKVGGMGYYCDYFGPLSSRLRALECEPAPASRELGSQARPAVGLVIEAESELASAYRFPGLGRVTFLQDADAADPLVGLASIVGKYLRELLMGRIVRWVRAAATPETCAAPEELPPASGYRDPNTKKFVAATELVRAHRGVPDRCFLRDK